MSMKYGVPNGYISCITGTNTVDPVKKEKRYWVRSRIRHTDSAGMTEPRRTKGKPRYYKSMLDANLAACALAREYPNREFFVTQEVSIARCEPKPPVELIYLT